MAHGYLYSWVHDLITVKTYRAAFHQSPGFTRGWSKTDRLDQRQQAELSIREQGRVNFLHANFLR